MKYKRFLHVHTFDWQNGSSFPLQVQVPPQFTGNWSASMSLKRRSFQGPVWRRQHKLGHDFNAGVPFNEITYGQEREPCSLCPHLAQVWWCYRQLGKSSELCWTRNKSMTRVWTGNTDVSTSESRIKLSEWTQETFFHKNSRSWRQKRK